jgi:hypothetical protein
MRSVADILGPWVDPNFESGLIQRCRAAWNKPLDELTNEEMATFLRQEIAVDEIFPLAASRVENGYDDDSEMYDGELEEKINEIKRNPSSQSTHSITGSARSE